MTTYWILCGNSGSGKSFLAGSLVEALGAEYVSSDELRLQLTGEETDQSVQDKVFWAIEEQLLLTEAEDCVVDATNAKVDDRRRMLEWCRKQEKIILIWVNTPLEICLARQKGRDRQVPEHAVIRMDGNLRDQSPCLADGADMLIVC